MSSVAADYGSKSTVYQREQNEKAAVASGKVTHTDFLKLLTKQLTTQDPLNPMQDLDFTAQLAQLQALDEQMAMTKSMQAMRIDSQLQAGTNMIGKYVSGTDEAGADAKGMVSRVVQQDGNVYVELANKQKVEVGSINNVWNDANSMYQEISNSGNVIGMWVEAGKDSAQQPIRGIVEKVMVENGQVQLKLYGGQTVTWDQVQELRSPTEDELWYTLPDEVREKVEKAREMYFSAVTGTDEKGNEASGIVANAELDGSKVYLILFTGERINLDDLRSEPRKPTANDVAKSLDGLWFSGLGKDGEEIGGIVVGAKEYEDGVAVLLDDGREVYYDTFQEIRKAENTDKARLHGQWATGVNENGETVEGVVTKRIEVEGKLALQLHTGEVVLCTKLTGMRDATPEETAMVPKEEG